MLFATCQPLLAQDGGADVQRDRGPIVITSERLSADKRSGTALFEGSVVAKTEDMTLYSDQMKVYYSEDGNIDRIQAEGSVKLVSKDSAVTSDNAEYLAREQKIVFTGNPKAVEGANVITGSRMTYLIGEDRSIVEDSKVILEQRPGGPPSEE